MGGPGSASSGSPQVPRVQSHEEVLPCRSLPTASQAQPRRHERKVDKHARKRMYEGRAATSSEDQRGGGIKHGR